MMKAQSRETLTDYDEDSEMEYNYSNHSRRRLDGSDNDNFDNHHDEMEINSMSSASTSTLELFIFTITTSIGGILSGYHLAIISPALPSIVNALSLSGIQAESVVAALFLGGVLGSVIAGPQCDFWGRKPTIIYTDIMFILGSVIVVLSHGYTGVMWGRFFTGTAIASSMVANVSFLTEMAPQIYRGSVVSVNELFVCLGFFLAYFIGYNVVHEEQQTAPQNITSVAKDNLQYKYMYGVTIVWALIQLIATAFYLPESQAWLYQQHQRQYERATDINYSQTKQLQWYHYRTWIYWWTEGIVVNSNKHSSDSHSISNLEDAESTIDQQTFMSTSTQYSKQALFVLSFLAVAEQSCGHNVVLSFVPELFAEVLHLEEDEAAIFIPAIFLGLIKLFLTGYVIWEVDTMGRRKFLLTGVAIICFSYILLISTYSHQHTPSILEVVVVENHYNRQNDIDLADAANSTNTAQKILLTLGTCGLVIGYSISFGPLTQLITSELFPTNIRGRALAMSAIGNFLSGYFVSYTFLSGQKAFGNVAPFIAYFVNSVCALAVTYVAVPETGGCNIDGPSRYLYERMEGMVLWTYATQSQVKRERDYISTLTSTLTSYEDHDDDDFIDNDSGHEVGNINIFVSDQSGSGYGDHNDDDNYDKNSAIQQDSKKSLETKIESATDSKLLSIASDDTRSSDVSQETTNVKATNDNFEIYINDGLHSGIINTDDLISKETIQNDNASNNNDPVVDVIPTASPENEVSNNHTAAIRVELLGSDFEEVDSQDGALLETWS